MNAQITNATVQGKYVSTFLELPSAIAWREIFLFKIRALEVKISRIFSTNLSQEVFTKMAYNYAMRQVLFLLLSLEYKLRKNL